MDKPPAIPRLNPKGTWRTYTTAEGLAGLNTEHIAEDAEGYLWVGIFGSGACRFDGDEFRTFTTREGLPGNRVQALLLDRQGRLWFGTDGGACWWDGKEFHRFDRGDGVSDKLISFIFEDQEGRVWCAGSEALGYYDGSFHDLAPAYGHQQGQPHYDPREYNECEGIAQDRAGHLWFAFITNLVRYDGEDFHRYGAEHGLPPGRRTVGRDAAGDLWIGAGGTLYRYWDQTFQPVPIETKTPWIRKIQRDQEGRTWFCTSGNGVFCYDGTEFHHFTPQDGLAYTTVNAMYQDREGQIWFATWGGGLSCYDPQSTQVLDEKEGLPFNTVTTLAADHQGRIWVGFGLDPRFETSRVISCYDGEHLETLGEQEGMDNCLTLYVDSRDYLWCGGLGLRQYESGRFRKVAMGEELEKVGIWAIAEDQKGHLFFGYVKDTSTKQFFESPLQLTRYDGQKLQTLLTREKVDRNTYISALVAGRDGGLWFGLGSWTGSVGPGEGLGRWHEIEGIEYYTVEDGLVDNRVTDLIEDSKGHLWITTSGGISRFDGERFHNFTVADVLPSNQVYCACQDQQGHLWFGTDNGVVHYDGHTFQTIRSPQIILVIDLLQDRQGRFWFATNNGLVRYIPGRVPPRVRILQVVAGQVYEQAEEISTSSQQILFEYKGMSFRTSPKDMLYTCRLVGREEEWQPATREMRAFYQDLSMGDYTFQVRAIDRDLNYSEPASVRLKVIPDLRDQKIDELEQRVRERTRELEEKNRALVVEAALERVRGKVVGMQKTTDIGNVVAVMWEELKGRGLIFQRCSILTVDEAHNLWTSYNIRDRASDTADVRRTLQDTPHNLQVSRELIGRDLELSVVRSALDADDWVKDRLEVWRAQKRVAQLLSADQVAAHAQRLGIPSEAYQTRFLVSVPFDYGSLGLGTTSSDPDQFSDEDLDLLQRFAQVFSTGYTRFLDLQQAEARAREAQVEAALERVRGKALGMQKNEDFIPVATGIFQELGNLELRPWRSGFWIIDADSSLVDIWTWGRWEEGQSERQNIIRQVPLFGHWGGRKAYEVWKNQEAWTGEATGEGMAEWMRYALEHGRSDSAASVGMKFPDHLWTNCIPFSHGTLSAVTLEPLSDEEMGVLQKFAVVLSLAYTRFLDLQQAEERARQASRQAAVDRVRAEIASMRTSADLERVTPLLRKELTGLSVPFSRCGVFIVDEEQARLHAYLTNPQGLSLAALHLPFDSHPTVRATVDHWREQKIHVEQWDQQAFVEMMQSLIAQGQPIQPERFLDAGPPPEKLTLQFVPFTHGMLYVGSAVPLSEEDIDLVKSLAAAFSIAYARYLDFQHLEEKNRQIEQASQYKSQFLSRMSHDLRTPMNAIIGYTHILLRKAKDTLDERQYHNLENIEVSAQHLLFLINDILDLSRVEAGRIDLKPEPVDLGKLVAQCAASVESLLKPGVELKQEIADLAPLHTDADRLNRVLMNLLSNAVKFTQKGRITVSVKPADGWVELSVADTGIGIPAEDLPSIFEEFRQSGRRGEGEKQGSGLGLEIAKRSVELLGGSISVESAVGKGTKFTLRIRDYGS